MNIKKNKIYNMDCRKYLPLLPSKSIHLIVIDPPYNELPKEWDNFKDWKLLKKDLERVLVKNGQLYIFGKQPMLANIMHDINDLFTFRFEIIWNKNKGMWASNYMPMRSHELIWCFKKKGTKVSDLHYDIDSIKTPGEPYIRRNRVKSTIRNNWKENLTIVKDGRRFPLSVIEHPSVTRKDKTEGQPHPTQKPLKIIETLIKSSSKKKDTILDCFMGSGTTAVASKHLDRSFMGCEVDKEFYKLCVKRLSEN